jgi:hypothetical protein
MDKVSKLHVELAIEHLKTAKEAHKSESEDAFRKAVIAAREECERAQEITRVP